MGRSLLGRALLLFTLLLALPAARGAAQDGGLPATIVGVEWRLVSLQGAAGELQDTTGSGVTLSFGADGSVSGSGGCNGYGGQYTAGPEQALTIGQLISTLRACEGAVGELEQAYFAALARVARYDQAQPGTLQLTLDDGVGRLGFVAAAAPAPTATPTAAPTVAGPPQAISIDSPPEGTVIGSPVTITGRTARYPVDGALGYRFVDAAQQPIGAGTFPVSGAPGGPSSFVASLALSLPPQGGPIRLDIFDRDPASGAPLALVSWGLFVAEPQSIRIDSPAPGTQVGSPLTVTGRVGRLPSQARLTYIVSASDGRQLGAGSFPVAGSPGAPAFFSASLSFAAPLEGDSITLQLLDQDPATGGVAAAATLPLLVAPAPQRIAVTSPGAGAFVGTPVVITGRTVRYPLQGTLGYAIYAGDGRQVGGGVFPVAGSLETGGSFNATLGFAYPPEGGPLRVDLYDQDPFSGQFRATTTLNLRTVPLQQSISISSPAPGTRVGSPVTLAGGTARYPSGGVLQWRISDERGNVVGAGSFPVQGPFGEPARFSASLNFSPPGTSSRLRAEIFEADQFGNLVASSAVDLSWVVEPPPAPPPAP